MQKVKIIDIVDSPKKEKRFRVIMNDGKNIDFGLKGGETFLDHKDVNKRSAYMARHFANRIEKHLISNLIPSPSVMSAFLLWNTSDLEENIKILNKLFLKKYG